MGEKGVWVFQRWLRDQFAADVPLDELVRRIVAAPGSTWNNPPSSFYRTNRDPTTAAETVAQVFLGIRLQCARCHNHPFDVWTQDDYYGLAAFFSQHERKQINNNRKRQARQARDQRRRDHLPGRASRDGPAAHRRDPGAQVSAARRRFEPADPIRQARRPGRLADAEQSPVRRNLANRTWFHLMGRGIVEPVDDFRDSNPPSNPALLDASDRHLLSHGMRLKPLVALIMKSRTYQLDATPTRPMPTTRPTSRARRCGLLPGRGPARRASARSWICPTGSPRAPASLRAAQLPGRAPGSAFLKMFGKPERLLTCECERAETTTLAQAFQMINGQSVRRKLDAPDNRIGRLLDGRRRRRDPRRTLPRRPLPRADVRRARSRSPPSPRARDRAAAWQDVAWALLTARNSCCGTEYRGR